MPRSPPGCERLAATENGALAVLTGGPFDSQVSELIDFDREGNARAVRSLNTRLVKLAPGNGGSAIAAGRRGGSDGPVELVVAKLDASGSVLWSKAYPAANFDPVDVVAVTSGGYAILGQTNGLGPTDTNLFDDAALLRIDENGAPLGITYVGLGGRMDVRALTRTSSGSFWITGRRVLPTFNPHLAMIRIATNGAVVQSKVLGDSAFVEEGRAVASDSTGGATIIGKGSTATGNRLFVVHVDGSGTITWQRQMPLSTLVLEDFGRAAAVGSDVVLDVEDFVSGTFGRVLARIDASGNLAWARAMSTSGGDVETKALSVDGAGFVWLGGHAGSSASIFRMAGTGAFAAGCPPELAATSTGALSDASLPTIEADVFASEQGTTTAVDLVITPTALSTPLDTVCGP